MRARLGERVRRASPRHRRAADELEVDQHGPTASALSSRSTSMVHSISPEMGRWIESPERGSYPNLRPSGDDRGVLVRELGAPAARSVELRDVCPEASDAG